MSGAHEQPFPALAGLLIREVLARQQQELNEVFSAIAEVAGVRIEEGWQVDVQGARFVRQATTPAPEGPS